MPKNTFGDPVDVATGAWVSNHTDLTLGGSDPRGLTFTRFYDSNNRYNDSAGLGFGWTHNYDIRATRRSGVRAGLGLTTSYQAAPFIVAFTAASELYDNHTTAKEWATAALAVHWAVDQLTYKAVAVTQGLTTAEFIEMPDGTFVAPAGMKLSLAEPQPGEFALTQRHGSTTHFEDGRAVSIVDPHGNTQSFTYAGEELAEVEDAYGRTLTFSGSGGRIGSVSDSTGRSVSFGYANDDLTSVTDVEGKTSGFVYDGEHRVTRATDGMGRTVVENDYDSKGRVIIQRNRGDPNRTYQIFYTGSANSEQDPEGGVITHLYDNRGRPLGNIDALGNLEVILHDAQDRRMFYSSRDSDALDYYYDPDHNLVEVVDQQLESTVFWYDTELRLEEMSDNRWNNTFYTYNDQHQVLTVTDAEDGVLTNTYHANGNLATRTDGEERTTTFGYDAWGQLNKITFHDEKFETFVNNARGDGLSKTDPEGRTVTSTWNARRQLLSVTYAPGTPIEATTSNTYNDAGQLASSTDANGNTTGYTHDASGNRLTVTVPALPAGNNVVTTAYDSRDLVESVTNSLSHTSLFGYDAAKRLILATSPLLHETGFSYDATGRLLEVKDALDRITKQQWTPRSEKQRDTNGLDQHADFTYDENGNLTHLKNRRGHTFVTAFDAVNRAVSTTTPLGRTTATTYFDNGQPHTVTEPSSQQTTFAYNARGLLQTKTDPTGAITYAYDDSGQLLTVTESSAVITRTYDARARVATFQNADGDLIQYQYDANGNLTRLTYPGGKQVHYTYNARNLLATVTDWNNRQTSYTYDRLGQLTGIQRPNGTAASFTYDAMGQRLDAKESRNGSLFSYLRFGYDAAGQITNRFRAPLPPPGMAHPTVSATYDNDNRLLTVGGQSITHDLDGNMTLGPIRPDSGPVGLTYNARNQLTAADGTTYTYDAEGRRRTLTTGGDTTRFVTDPGSALGRLLIKHGPNSEVTYYVYGIGLLYEVNESGESRTYHYDQVGSTIALTGDDGKVLGRAEYTAYGLIARQQGDMDTPFLYNGQYGVMTDPNGLLHMRARYYSPYLMRFVNPDPSGFSGGMNWFAYADGNPISLLDPFGLDAMSGGNLDMSRYGALGGYGTGNGSVPFPEWSDYSTGVHMSLDGFGLIPGLGEFADGANALIYLAEGNYVDAGLSGAAMIPFAGWGATAGKVVRYADDAGDGMVTIYRGVHGNHPDLPNAFKGEANPMGGHTNPARHNEWDNASEFTSWTTDRNVAVDFATQWGQTGGVVLEQTVPRSSLIPSPDIFKESEVLRLGPVSGATPTILMNP